MSTAAPEPKTGEVVLIRIGVGREEHPLPEGASLGDLLRAARANTEDQEIYINGRPVADLVILEPGAIVSLVPRPRGAGPAAPWRGVIGAFQNNPAFDEMMEQVEAERAAEKEAP